MKSILSATACAAVMALAIPAVAATGDAPMHHHHHHMMHGKHGMMKKDAMSGDAATEKLNEQSLQNAKAGAMPASGSDTSTTGMTAPGAMTDHGAMTAPAGAMTAPGTGAMGTTMPANAPPMTNPPAAASSNSK